MRKIFLILIFLIFSSTTIRAETTKGGYAACLTEDLLDQITQAAVRKDRRGLEYLLKHGCVVMKAGIPVSILKKTWTGTVKMRAYIGNDALILWTVNENIVR